MRTSCYLRSQEWSSLATIVGDSDGPHPWTGLLFSVDLNPDALTVLGPAHYVIVASPLLVLYAYF